MEFSQGKLSLNMGWLIVVDHENPANFDPKHLPKDALVLIFLGSHQNSLSVELIQKTQPLGERVQWVKVSQAGPNAADFVLAYELGCWLTKSPAYKHIAILSCDKGFDALAKHIASSHGRKCCRIEKLNDLSTSAPAPVAKKTIAEYLKASTKNRPATLATLTKYIASHLQKDASDPAVLEAIQKLKDAHLIQDDSGKISYPKWNTK